MAIIKLFFSDTPIGKTDSSGTNMFSWKNNTLSEEKYTAEEYTTDTYYSKDCAYSLSFKLLEDIPLVKKFITNLKNKILSFEKYNGNISWNRYTEGHLDQKDYRMFVDALNSNLADAVSSMGRNANNFDNSLKIEESDDIIEISRKLNAIHFAFENLSLIPMIAKNEKKRDLCERLNFLVHQIEPFLKTHKPEERIFYVTRIKDDGKISDPLLSDEDYNTFDSTEYGDLCLDFYTVGKDMHACSTTKDLDLIKNKEVKSQTLISSCFNFTIKKDFFKNYERCNSAFEKNKERHYDWCKKNNVDQYYDYTLPKYNIGRAKLGTLLENDYDEITTNLNKYRHLVGVSFIDE